MKFRESFEAASNAGIPLLAVQTIDPTSTVRVILDVLGEDTPVPVIVWDIVTGLKPLNEAGKASISAVAGGQEPAARTVLAEMLDTARGTLPDNGILIIKNAHRYLTDNLAGANVSQAIWNERNPFKENGRMLILLCPSIKLPEELAQDVVILDHEPLTEPELKKIVKKVYDGVIDEYPELSKPTPELLQRAAEACKGLSAFVAENAVAMSFGEKGLVIDRLLEKQRKSIEQIGLPMWRGKETFQDVKGIEEVKKFLHLIFKGRSAPNVIVFMDETDKQLAGAQGGDASGVTQEMNGMMLSWMADNDIPGLNMVGFPGCSKSYITKAAGGEFDAPVVILNISNLKGMYVGQSTQRLDNALKAILAMGRPIVMATCNKMSNMSAEWLSRFQLGIWFFDLFNQEERRAVWEYYFDKYKLDQRTIPPDEGWTPREIMSCCNLSWRLKLPPTLAAGYIIPVTKRSPELITDLRGLASNNAYLSASYPGTYTIPTEVDKVGGKRSIKLVSTGGVGEA